MTSPQCPTDPVSDIVNVFTTAMRQLFDPDQDCPPLGKGSKDVRFFAGDDSALLAWEPGKGCPVFLWVRVPRRFRSRLNQFPAAFVGNRDCRAADVVRVVEIEVGVARCATVDTPAKWDKLESENEISLDDSWRIERVLKVALCELQGAKRAFASDTVGPSGPEGGVMAWTGVAYVQM